MGDNALTTDLTDGCFDLSDNFLVVIRTELDLSIQFKNSENGSNPVTNRSIKPQLRVSNDGIKPIDLTKVTMRYWFTEDASGGYAADCQGSDAGCPYTTLSLMNFSPAAVGADSYLEVGFTSGTLMPGEQVNTRSLIRRSDGQNFNEADDHSFIGPASDHVENPNVTLYYDGNLIAGNEPTGYTGLRLAGRQMPEKLMEVSVFPNPFSNRVQIELPETPAAAYEIRITNLQGQTVFVAQRSGMSENVQLGELPAGLYLLQIREGDHLVTKRLVKN
jgi:hypothetical protein